MDLRAAKRCVRRTSLRARGTAAPGVRVSEHAFVCACACVCVWGGTMDSKGNPGREEKSIHARAFPALLNHTKSLTSSVLGS